MACSQNKQPSAFDVTGEAINIKKRIEELLGLCAIERVDGLVLDAFDDAQACMNRGIIRQMKLNGQSKP
jgi:hypothetical protein